MKQLLIEVSRGCRFGDELSESIMLKYGCLENAHRIRSKRVVRTRLQTVLHMHYGVKLACPLGASSKSLSRTMARAPPERKPQT